MPHLIGFWLSVYSFYPRDEESVSVKRGAEAIHHFVEMRIEKNTRAENKKRRPMAAFRCCYV